MNGYSLLELAEKVGADVQFSHANLHGDNKLNHLQNLLIYGAGTLEDGKTGEIGFLAESRYQKHLPQTGLSAVLLTEKSDDCPAAQLIVADVKKAWRQITDIFATAQNPPPAAGTHMTASVDPSASIGAGATIEAGAVIGANAEIGAGCHIGALAFIADGVKIGENGVIGAGVRILPRTEIGARVHILANAVIGERGFGFSYENGSWQPIAQLGGVKIGDDVEIGACTTIDRGAVRDTIIGDRVKLDNHIQIGHNVIIGEDTIIAGAAVIAGSVRFGRGCVVGGASVFAGHITICDGAQFAGHSSVSKSITSAGAYCSALTVMPDRKWKRFVAKLKFLAKD